MVQKKWIVQVDGYAVGTVYIDREADRKTIEIESKIGEVYQALEGRAPRGTEVSFKYGTVNFLHRNTVVLKDEPAIPSEVLEEDAFRATRDSAGTFGIECATRWSSVHQGGNMWAAYDCYLTAMRDILGLRLPEHEPYKFWEQATIEGGFRVVHPEFCIVCDFPETIKVDDQHRPHCADGPSHRWRDGWSLYHWHGVRIPEEWIRKPETLTPAVALQTTNLELRRAACEILGWGKILDKLGARVINDDGDPLVGCLVEVTLPGLQAGDSSVIARFLRVRCGTGRDFAVCVDPSCGTALEAQAWMRGDKYDKRFKMPEVRT